MPIYCVNSKTKAKIIEDFKARQGGVGTSDPCAELSDGTAYADPDVNPDPQDGSGEPPPPESEYYGGVFITPTPPPAAGGPVEGEQASYQNSIMAGFFHADIADYHAMSSPSNLVAARHRASDVWYIRDPRGLVGDLLVGSRVSGSALMNTFMWDYRQDAFLWLVSNELQRRRSSDNSVIESVTLPTQVADKAGTVLTPRWFSGRRNSIHTRDGVFVLGDYQNGDKLFVLPIRTDPLSYDLNSGFWLHDVSGIGTTNAADMPHQKASGWAFHPKSLDPLIQNRLYEVQPERESAMSLIETTVSSDDWSEPIFSGNEMAYWSNLNSRLEIVDISPLLESPKSFSFPLLRAISIQEMAQAYGMPEAYLQYQHGHLNNGRLVFSVRRYDTSKFGVLIYNLLTDQLYASATEFDAGIAISGQPQPSISKDGEVAVFKSNAGLRVMHTKIPTTGGDVSQYPYPLEDREPFFHWEAGDVSVSDWQEFLSSLPIDATTGRPRTYNNSNYFSNPRGGRIVAPGSFELPTMRDDGALYFNIHAASFDLHNQLRFWTPGQTDDNAWMRARVTYRMDFEFELLDASGVNWSTDPQSPDVAGDAIRWGILHQQWGNYGPWSSIPEADRPAQRLSPVFALELASESTAGLSLITRIRGTSLENGIFPWQTNLSLSSPISLGLNRFSIKWRADPTGTDSCCRVWHNGATIHDIAGTTETPIHMGTPFDFLGNYALPNVAGCSAGNPVTGLYTPTEFASPGVEVLLRLVKHWKLNAPAVPPANPILP